MEFNRFDVSAKELVWDDPGAWLDRMASGPPGPVEVIDSDITALTAAADKVIRVGGPEPYLVNFELERVQDMQESTTYQAILREGHNAGLNEGLNEGRIREARRLLLRQGTKRLGDPDAATVAALESIQDIDRLEMLHDRAIDADIQDWKDLLRVS